MSIGFISGTKLKKTCLISKYDFSEYEYSSSFFVMFGVWPRSNLSRHCSCGIYQYKTCVPCTRTDRSPLQWVSLWCIEFSCYASIVVLVVFPKLARSMTEDEGWACRHSSWAIFILESSNSDVNQWRRLSGGEVQVNLSIRSLWMWRMGRGVKLVSDT